MTQKNRRVRDYPSAYCQVLSALCLQSLIISQGRNTHLILPLEGQLGAHETYPSTKTEPKRRDVAALSSVC